MNSGSTLPTFGIGLAREARIILLTGTLMLLIIAGCTTPRHLFEIGDMEPADISVEEFLERTPDYSRKLVGLSGTGRLMISQPGNSDRLSLEYHSDRSASLVTFRSRIGIEGGQLLATRDSILVYNRVDRRAERYALQDADLTEIGALATINLTELFHFTLTDRRMEAIYQDENHYIAFTRDGWRISIDKEHGYVREVNRQSSDPDRFSRILYEEYTPAGDFVLPRRITIFSTGGETRLILLVQRLQANPILPPLHIDLPDDIPVITL